ncbi:hypothetical protein [Caudoviricetes sp.]|nr:hypothetical protein [Caudoviricetes sp.]
MALNIGASVVEGLSNAADYGRDTPNREARNSQAKLIKAQADAQLQSGMPQAQADKDVAILQAQVADLKNEALKKSTYNAFDRYSLDGDTSHLNTFLEEAKKSHGTMFQDIVRVDPITDTPVVKAQLGQIGVDDTATYVGIPELAQSKVLATHPDGTQSVLDMNKLYAMTGYTNYMGEKRLKDLHVKTAIDQALNGPMSPETNLIAKIAKEKGVSLTEAAATYYKLKKPAGGGSGAVIERTADVIQEQNPEMDRITALEEAKKVLSSGSELEREARRLSDANGTSYQDEFRKLQLEQNRTAPRKQLDEANTVRQEIDTLAGGDFLAKPVDESTRRRIGPKITELEKLTGKELSTDDKKTARELRALFAMGDKAATELTPEVTGFIDNTLHNVKKYFTDNSKGEEGLAAYATFRNFARNALMGATLTPEEVKAFNSASGTAKQQLGPILADMKVQLMDMKNKLQSIYAFNDEHVAQYYLGTSLEQIDKSTHALDARIKFLSGIEDSKVKKVLKPSVPVQAQDAAKPTLDDIFGATK